MARRPAGMSGVLILAAACGTAPPAIPTSPAAPPRAMDAGGDTDVRLQRDIFVGEAALAADPATVWQVLPLIWAEIGLPVAQASNASRSIRSGTFRAPRRIAGKPLADFFDCGYSMAGPRVNLWDVLADVVATVRPDSAAGSRVNATIDAHARPRDGSGTSAVPCSSRGELERVLFDNLRARLGG